MISINDEILEQKTFPDGTPSFRIPEKVISRSHLSAPVTIEWKFDNMGELFIIQCLVGWLDSHSIMERYLKLPYIPNARMDRIKNEDEVFTFKTFAKVINSLNFTNVIVNNAHSNVSLALIDRVEDEGNKTIKSFIEQTETLDISTVMFPDDGACKRYSEIKEVTDKFNIVIGRKNRDWRTGEIKGLEIIGNPADVKDKNILIIDDICSKGGTFKFSAKKLKEMGAKDIYLYISHCENVIDIESLKEAGITRVYTTDSILRLNDSFIEVVN